jgi:hypothetical protein
MSENKVIAAILTVAFYTGRGGAMSMTQILATYDEMRAVLEAREPLPAKSGGRKSRR